MYRVPKGLFVVAIAVSVMTFCAASCGAEGKNVLTLEAAIEEAINNNTLIRQAIEEERAAIEGEKSARAELFPKLSTSFSYTRLKDPPFAIFGPTRVEVGEEDNFAWDVTVTQPIFTGFVLRTKREMAALGIDLQEIVKQQAILDIAKQVKISYFQILQARRALEVAKEEVRHLEAHVHDVRLFYEQGIIPYNDLLKSRVALAQARQKRVRAESNLRVAISGFNTLLRRDIMKETQIQELPPFQPSHYEISGLFEEAIRNRPELTQLKVAIEQAAFAIKLAKSSYYPQIYLAARYEREGDNLAASHNDFKNDHNSSLAVRLTWPFFEWGKKRADVREASHQKRALEQKLEGLKDSILLEVRDAFEKLVVAKENIHTAREALAQAKENFRITNFQYKEGVTTSTEVLDARAFLTQAEVNYYNALYGYRIAEAELKRAVGEK